MSFSYRENNRSRFGATAAVLAFALYLAAASHPVFGQTPPTTDPPTPGEPLHTVIPVHLDPATGDIKVGRTTYHGANPGLHLLALKRQPDTDTPDAPTVVVDTNFPASFNSYQDVINALSNIQTTYPDAMIIINAAGSYGFPVWAIGWKLVEFGGTVELGSIQYVPLAFVGIAGPKQGRTAPLERWNSTSPIDGYLATDSNGNYAFIRTDYVRYSITTDGTIAIGNGMAQKIYKVANASYKYPGCDAAASNSFHLVVLDRESLSTTADNAYCTGQNPVHFQAMATDLSGVPESRLVFIASNGHPIPADWKFGIDGDGRVYPLAQQFARLGGYFESGIYLTPNDAYSLVGAAPPPSFVARPRSRARESSSAYPDHPTGELHGVLARGWRDNWYSPLNADLSGKANLDFYDKVLAQAPTQPGATPEATFPQYGAGSDQANAFTSISAQICGAGCNPRNNYRDTNISIDNYLNDLQNIKGPGGVDCSQPANSGLPFCQVWQQLHTEFEYVENIRDFASNLASLGTISGVSSLFDLINTWQTVQGTLPAPAQPTAPSLVSPIVNLVLGLAGLAPTPLAPLFGLADTFFNFGESLTTDQNGSQTASLATPVATLANQAQANFTAQLSTIGTQFDLIYQNWQMMQPLGQFLGSGKPAWSWDTSTASQITQAMTPAVRQSMYRSLMSSVYAIGSYLPYGWGTYPLASQPGTYIAEDFRSAPYTPTSEPFGIPTYIPYTYPTDAGNQWAEDARTATLLADNTWLGISAINTPKNGTSDDFKYEPPGENLRTQLFTPVSQGGLGVYRPAFFEGWPFPRVQCDPTFNAPFGDGESIGGCNWAAAAPPLEGVPEPVTRVSVAVSNMTRTGTLVEVQLAVHNSGTQDITSIEISAIKLRTLAGAHEARLVEPALPIHIGKLTPGTSTAFILTLDVPQSVNKLELTESGTVDSGDSSPNKFSLGQVIFPKKQQ